MKQVTTIDARKPASDGHVKLWAGVEVTKEEMMALKAKGAELGLSLNDFLHLVLLGAVRDELRS